nr:unnamed protein product [Callosobruchus analis]CAI5866022.1 unnamed protein product [Callosobruchus analis]
MKGFVASGAGLSAALGF